MTKSIKEQAEEFAIENRGYDFFKDQVPFAIDMKNCFLAGAKARDVQWSAVVSELRASLEYYKLNAMSFKHCQEVSPDVEEYCNGEIADNALTKADQMLKKMNINKGE